MNASKWTSPKRRPLASESSLMSVALAALITLGTYAVLGSPEAAFAVGSRPVTQDTVLPVQLGSSSTSFVGLVQRLSDNLQDEPDDASGWLLLARSYEHLGRREEARVALDRARELGKTDAALDMTFLHGNPSPK